jgi:hypothetical protein
MTMNILVRAIRVLFGLFFDDGSLALVILAVLVALALLTHSGVIQTPVAIALLVGGTTFALFENVVRTALRRRY